MAHIDCTRVSYRLSAFLADHWQVFNTEAVEFLIVGNRIRAEFLPLDFSPQPDFEVVSLVIQAINPPL